MPVVSLVGYTNVGKSSLMNALCGPSVAEADYALCHPRPHQPVSSSCPAAWPCCWWTRSVSCPACPTIWWDAFKSTLEEAAWSDVIIRVADAGDEQREEQLAVTDEVLDGLDCTDIPRLTVYNQVRQAQHPVL